MGRRNESNRLEHKKKVDTKKKREQDAAALRKEKLKAIQQQFSKLEDQKSDEPKL